MCLLVMCNVCRTEKQRALIACTANKPVTCIAQQHRRRLTVVYTIKVRFNFHSQVFTQEEIKASQLYRPIITLPGSSVS